MKVVKKVAHGVRDVFRGVRKVFKKVTDSKIGKVLLIAATIYLGGAALGMWNVPAAVPFSSSINGAFVGGSKATAAAAGADVAGSTVAAAGSAPAAIPGSGVLAPGADAAAFTAAGATPAQAAVGATQSQLAAAAPGAVAPAAAASGGAKWNSLVEAGKPGVDTTTVSEASKFEKLGSMVGKDSAKFGGPAQKPGLIGRIGQAGEWIQDNPIPAFMGMNAASSMAAPDEIDLLNRERDLINEDRRRQERNYDVSGIDLGMAPTPRRFTWLDGTPVFERGLIGRQVGRGPRT